MAKVLTTTGLFLGLMTAGSLALSSPADAPRGPVEGVTTLLGDIASCS
jgi:hypothetical protein